MDKEEILRKAQARQGMDEMEAQVTQKGSETAMWVGLMLSMALMVCKMIAGQPWLDSYCVYAAMFAVLHLYKRYRLKQGHHLVWGLLWAVLAVFMLAAYLTQIFG